jgi:hypothetical protein
MIRDEAIKMYDTQWWLGRTPAEITRVQLYEPLCIMPFGDFQTAVEKALDRPVWTHEFAYPDSLKAEFEGKIGKPTFNEIVAKLPAHVRPIVAVLP